jgi:hypothetical protein
VIFRESVATIAPQSAVRRGRQKFQEWRSHAAGTAAANSEQAMSETDPNSEEAQLIPVEIPAYLWSVSAEAPFSECLDCQRPLLALGEQQAMDTPGCLAIGYQIQKLIVRGESVFEYALCMQCMQQLSLRFSEETKESVSRFVRTRLQSFPLITSEQALAGDLRCLICQCPRRDCYRYSLMGYCLGLWLMVNPGPVIVCEKCEEELSSLISEKTRREWDRFVEDHFDSPPGVEADSPHGIPMLI